MHTHEKTLLALQLYILAAKDDLMLLQLCF